MAGKGFVSPTCTIKIMLLKESLMMNKTADLYLVEIEIHMLGHCILFVLFFFCLCLPSESFCFGVVHNSIQMYQVAAIVNRKALLGQWRDGVVWLLEQVMGSVLGSCLFCSNLSYTLPVWISCWLGCGSG